MRVRAALAAGMGLAGTLYVSRDVPAVRTARLVAKRLPSVGWDAVYVGRILQQYRRASREGEGSRAAAHARGAELVVELCERNGGVYIKLGQMVAVLHHLVPDQYVVACAKLFDRAPVSPVDAVLDTVARELGRDVDEIFAHFDREPIASASLAQVHRATLKDGRAVVVKCQHNGLREASTVDLLAIEAVTELLHWAYPDVAYVDYRWLAQEAKRNLPEELDFRREAANADTARAHFAARIAERNDVAIPEIEWGLTTPQVLVMTFEPGVTVTDIAGMAAMGIEPADVATLVGQVFNQQIFQHGFVHCDPHPGNVLVRRVPADGGGGGSSRSSWAEQCWRGLGLGGWWAGAGDGTGARPQLVLLDHGLYRTLDDEMRLSYARFWAAIVKGDRRGMEDCAAALGAREMYPLLACMLTRKTWDVIVDLEAETAEKSPAVAGGAASVLAQAPTPQAPGRLTATAAVAERAELQSNVQQYAKEIVALLAKLNPDLLLLLKTNDCLMHMAAALDSPAMFYVTLMEVVTEALDREAHPTGLPWSVWLRSRATGLAIGTAARISRVSQGW